MILVFPQTGKTAVALDSEVESESTLLFDSIWKSYYIDYPLLLFCRNYTEACLDENNVVVFRTLLPAAKALLGEYNEIIMESQYDVFYKYD